MPQDNPWLESLGACVGEPLALLGADWSVAWCNGAFARAAAVARGLPGPPLPHMIDDWRAVERRIAAAMTARGAEVFPVKLLQADGSTSEAELRLQPCDPACGAAWALHLRDTQEANDLRRRLRDRDRSHLFLQSHTSDLIVRADGELVVTWRNEAAGALFPAGTRLAEVLAEESLAVLRDEARGARFDVTLVSAPEARPAFYLRGTGRRIVGESGAPEGLSLLLVEDEEQGRLAALAARLALTPRELEVVEYIVKGYSNLNIATLLGISESGVKFHLRNVFARAKVATRTELMAMLLGGEESVATGKG